MPNETLNGIVLRTTDYRESDRILNVLTKERGLVTVSARGCRRPNSRTAAFSSQFCYGEMVTHERDGKLILSAASVLESFYSIRESYEQLISATRIVMLAERVASRDISNDQFFLLVYHGLSFIAYGRNDPRDIELCFIAKLLSIMGYTPILASCVQCGRSVRGQRMIRFSKTHGGSLCDNCTGASHTVSALSLEAFRRMMRLDSRDMGKVVLPDNVRAELDRLLYDYAGFVFEYPIKR